MHPKSQNRIFADLPHFWPIREALFGVSIQEASIRLVDVFGKLIERYDLRDIEKYLVHSLQFATRFLCTDDDYTIKHYDILKKNYENLLNTCHD